MLLALMHLFPLMPLLIFQKGLTKEVSPVWAQLAIRGWKPTAPP